MKFTRRWLLAGLFAALSTQAFSQHADFPNKPVSLVVPFAAGGGLDVTARIIADRLKEELGQPVLIINRPGAGSAVGARVVAAAPADGYTLFITSGSAYGYLHLLVSNFELKLDDFVPVAAVASNPSVIVASTKLPVKTLGELADYGRNKPGEISFCSTGAGGLNHLQLEMFKRAVKAKGGKDFTVTHVPYNGLAPALTGVRDGSVQACTLPYTALVKNLNGKDLRVLAVQRGSRLPWLPDVPTTGQQGFPELDGNDAFINIAAPKGTPAPIVAKLEAALQKTMADAAVRKKLDELEVQPVYMNAKETQKWLEDDVRKFSGLIKESGLAVK
ncbi:tripartite tricarboxylate transporter substrate binding protein [Ramlibacter sp. XY19]|uniref:Bug family tripartite tricarboxylate transporter substrate binding protein n=1 Tax=Ramlibacter paludis TaxID=2908000 RepID=UPI0023DA5105|nr:tripartite tricarboxylate transporter substrate binding protein [Ramlibacter paludis]MCG2592913.1 tripartite tricarboxylate transporter substrate binding protein [Ramlibacter paludis]